MAKDRLSARLRRRLRVSLGGKLPAVTANVSRQGFCAEMSGVFLPGSQVHGELEVGGKRYPFKGEVAWARAGDPRLSVASRFGVRFTEIAADFLRPRRR